MAVVSSDYPVLEFDTDREGLFRPGNAPQRLPERCVMCFFGEEVKEFAARTDTAEAAVIPSEVRRLPVYTARRGRRDFCVVQAMVGAPAAAMQVEYLYRNGVETIVSCGGCGVLEEVPMGRVLLARRALRDEGVSYKYLPPSRTVELDGRLADRMERQLLSRGISPLNAVMWTTDAFYRESGGMADHRRREGCTAVDMECAALAAVARFRQKEYGALFYGGDLLSPDGSYDERGWFRAGQVRKDLFDLTVEVVLTL